MDKLAAISVEAAQAVAGFQGKDIEENIKTVMIPGGRIEDSSIIYGIVVEKERTSLEMPRELKMPGSCFSRAHWSSRSWIPMPRSP